MKPVVHDCEKTPASLLSQSAWTKVAKRKDRVVSVGNWALDRQIIIVG